MGDVMLAGLWTLICQEAAKRGALNKEKCLKQHGHKLNKHPMSILTHSIILNNELHDMVEQSITCPLGDRSHSQRLYVQLCLPTTMSIIEIHARNPTDLLHSIVFFF